MRKLSIYILAGAVSFSSCKKDFLELAPETSVSAATFFQTQSQFDQALSGAYEPLRGIINPAIYMDEMRSDNAFFTYYAPDRGPANWVEDIIYWRDNPQTTVVNARYNSDYSGISRVNAIADRIVPADIPDTVKNRILGEALFLRAFYYFDLVQHYGGVPLHLKDVTTTEDAFAAKASAADVYTQIVTDLTAAIPNLPVVTSFPQSGRATKGAAKMLLAYAYMSQPEKDYPGAEIQLKDITNMSYQLQGDYASVFDPANKNNSESIFEIQYQEGNDLQENKIIYTILPKTTNTSVLTGGLAVNNLTQGGWDVPTQNLIDSYEEGDTRLPASISVIEGTLAGDAFTYESEHSATGYTAPAGKAYRYFIKKFLHPPYQREFNTNDNWPVFRYAGALLLLSECLVEEGKAGDAIPYINQVRNRAGLGALGAVTADDVANEMRHELAFENHRYTDLIRTGKAIEVLSAHATDIENNYSNIPPNSFNITEDRLIYPIPFRELQLDNKLVQNPGY